ncbi:MAG: PD40 domain-containing protein, partial [Bacteroidetes bacterium]|nr:PD40 domain-containing protein [Bacteroidota bacterium]
NVGPTINTKYDEDGPFIHPDGITLLFASNGHKSMGGFDIFFSTIEEDKKFSEPTNMGYPINTPDDDVFFVTSPDGKRGYFSSAKDGGFGEKDIYKMFIPDAKEKPLALFKGLIVPADGEKLPDDLEIVVTNKETGELVGRYRPKENGTFATILAPNKNYNFSYQAKGQEFYNEDIFVTNDIAYQEIKKEINLEPVNLLGTIKTKTKGVILNMVVLNNPVDKQPVPNAKVTLTEKGGSDTNFDTDANGKKDAAPLAFDKLYTVVAEANGKKSKPTAFNTVGIKGSKSITQVIYLEDAPLASNTGDKGKGKGKNKGKDNTDNQTPVDASCGSPVKFKQNFGYNVNEIEEANDWEVLINAIVSKLKDCNPTVKIMSSASQVPTKAFADGNKGLAASRADKMEEKIKAAVTAKGGDASKIEFVKISAVRGPSYESDYQNTKKYGPFQYVRVIAR